MVFFLAVEQFLLLHNFLACQITAILIKKDKVYCLLILNKQNLNLILFINKKKIKQQKSHLL